MTSIRVEKVHLLIDLEELKDNVRDHNSATSAALAGYEITSMPIEMSILVNGATIKTTIDLVAYDSVSGISLVALRRRFDGVTYFYEVRLNSSDELEYDQSRLVIDADVDYMHFASLTVRASKA